MDVEPQPGQGGSDVFAWRTRRLVMQFSLGWAILLLLGPIPVHFLGLPEVPYWMDVAVMAAHGMGLVAIGAWWLARRGQTEAGAYLLTGAIFVGVWIGVAWAAGTAYENVGAFFFLAAPLVAGLLLGAREASWIGGVQLPMIGLAGAWGMFPAVTAVTSAFAVAGVTISIAVSAALRDRDRDRILQEQARAEDHAKELEAVVDVATDGIVVLDEGGRLVLWNQAAGPMLHMDAAHMQQGALFAEILPMDVLKDLRPSLVQAPYGIGAPRECAWRGQVLRVSVSKLPTGLVVVVTDLTEERLRARVERDRVAQAMEIEKLQEINAFKTRLLNTASHELNTPLTPVRLQLELLKSTARGPLNEKQLRSVEILDRNARRMEALVRDILDVARMEADRLRIHADPVALGTLVADECGSFESAAIRKGVDLMVDVEDVWVEADARRMAQVMQNLLNNAIKFTPTGGTITVTCQREEDQARVVVRDTGIGIPEAKALELFTPFSQFHEESRAYGGTGLGLFICKGIIEAHGGAIGCQSDGESRGSLFWFTIPVVEVDLPEGEPREERLSTHPAGPPD